MAAKSAAAEDSRLERLISDDGPKFYPIQLEEKSFALVNCTFTDAKFDMKYFAEEGKPYVLRSLE